MPFDFEDEDTPPAKQVERPVVVVRGRVRLAEFGGSAGPHRFGGPLDLDVRGTGGTPIVLHRVLTLALSDPLLGVSMRGIAELPLVYGFLHDACRIKYRVISERRIEMLEMPEAPPSTDWPYENYPSVFPELRFALRDDGEIDPDDVEDLTWQGVEEIDPAEGMVAIVPPSAKYGVSLWGDGDEEMVQVVFEVDPEAGTVVATNQCT